MKDTWWWSEGKLTGYVYLCNPEPFRVPWDFHQFPSKIHVSPEFFLWAWKKKGGSGNFGTVRNGGNDWCLFSHGLKWILRQFSPKKQMVVSWDYYFFATKIYPIKPQVLVKKNIMCRFCNPANHQCFLRKVPPTSFKTWSSRRKNGDEGVELQKLGVVCFVGVVDDWWVVMFC